MSNEKICKHCHMPVVANAEQYEVFEQMHWLCFHLVFEHNGDPDVACADPSCPWGRIEALEDKLRDLGVDPNAVVAEAFIKKNPE